ncbi:hypothetical protein ANANG_G00206200 [Anguilla anguilla]|uniref:Uncharacterized protein n=1 Tax=Anguilla anguilla TaxID=7936 RepID=A0A9D3LYW4_ANGAN|nr:hypothetical protein ANANG_G00206200 [Anguilla anguilla]
MTRSFGRRSRARNDRPAASLLCFSIARLQRNANQPASAPHRVALRPYEGCLCSPGPAGPGGPRYLPPPSAWRRSQK